MWQTKTFKTKEAMQKFIDSHNIQWNVVFINCPKVMRYAIEYRKLKVISWGD
jgi:hypothetical protein